MASWSGAVFLLYASATLVLAASKTASASASCQASLTSASGPPDGGSEANSAREDSDCGRFQTDKCCRKGIFGDKYCIPPTLVCADEGSNKGKCVSCAELNLPCCTSSSRVCDASVPGLEPLICKRDVDNGDTEESCQCPATSSGVYNGTGMHQEGAGRFAQSSLDWLNVICAASIKMPLFPSALGSCSEVHVPAVPGYSTGVIKCKQSAGKCMYDADSESDLSKIFGVGASIPLYYSYARDSPELDPRHAWTPLCNYNTQGVYTPSYPWWCDNVYSDDLSGGSNKLIAMTSDNECDSTLWPPTRDCSLQLAPPEYLRAGVYFCNTDITPGYFSPLPGRPHVPTSPPVNQTGDLCNPPLALPESC